MTSDVRKAVIPAAGLGTRFLPAAKAVPKEMLPVVDRPTIQYVVEEAVRIGLDDLLIITGRGKGSLEDHFDRSIELEAALEAGGKFDQLKEVRRLAELADIHFVRQGEARGLGHAVSVARKHVGDHPFAVMLGDDIMDYRVLDQMIAAHRRTGGAVVALKRVSTEEISLYGSAEVEPAEDGLVRLRGLVEKPKPADAPSDLAVVGRYVFAPEIFDALDRTKPGVGGEIQLTDAIAILLEEAPVYGYVFEHGRFDIGKKIDYLRATVELALERDDVGPELAEFLADVVRRRGIV
ncbi:MAG TPA: UTP--glucose-1-phosphate uridylyltransferase GalU [Acidimicrobiales bacterium]|jgi:UTP--glucose-1-phosphate uridylyltransferase|nr:UTP--glucose-1-phosphate uridylyltransferase GalU [Acidimicrobiales bacterium]